MTGLRTTPPAPEDAIREALEEAMHWIGGRAVMVPGSRKHSTALAGALLALPSLVAAKEAAEELVTQVTSQRDEQATLAEVRKVSRRKMVYPGFLHPVEERRFERARAALAALSEPERNTTEEEP